MCLLADLPWVEFNGESFAEEAADLIHWAILLASEIEHETVKMLGSYFCSLWSWHRQLMVVYILKACVRVLAVKWIPDWRHQYQVCLNTCFMDFLLILSGELVNGAAYAEEENVL